MKYSLMVLILSMAVTWGSSIPAARAEYQPPYTNPPEQTADAGTR